VCKRTADGGTAAVDDIVDESRLLLDDVPLDVDEDLLADGAVRREEEEGKERAAFTVFSLRSHKCRFRSSEHDTTNCESSETHNPVIGKEWPWSLFPLVPEATSTIKIESPPPPPAANRVSPSLVTANRVKPRLSTEITRGADGGGEEEELSDDDAFALEDLTEDR
jgi:hypothetical protein